MANRKTVVYVVEEYGSIRLITTNKNTAFYYWFERRQHVYGTRPDVFMFLLGKFDSYIQFGDQEIQDYINDVEKRKMQKCE